MTGQQLYEWLEAALEMGQPRCDLHRHQKLRLIWIADEDGDLITWHIECPFPKCNREFKLLVGFTYLEIPDD